MRSTLQVLCESPKARHGTRNLGGAVIEPSPQKPNLAPANRVAFSSMAFEHRLKFAGRRTDNAQHFGGRRLLLQRLGEIIGALTQLVEQPRVFDGDNGLCGEVLKQFDLSSR